MHKKITMPAFTGKLILALRAKVEMKKMGMILLVILG